MRTMAPRSFGRETTARIIWDRPSLGGYSTRQHGGDGCVSLLYIGFKGFDRSLPFDQLALATFQFDADAFKGFGAG